MAKVKKSLLLISALVLVFTLSAAVLSACASKDYTVKFMVYNEATSDWEQYDQRTTEGGAVTLPSNPSKNYYVFRNWYADVKYTGDPFTGENVKKDMEVYAYFVPTEITINVTKTATEADAETVYTKDLEALKADYEAQALENNLTFYGWYTGADYRTLWSASSDVDKVYGRFMAVVTYDNGYESYPASEVLPGTVIAQPSLETIQKSYMSNEDIYYVTGDDYCIFDQSGTLTGYKEFDFSQPITQNTAIKVLWKTPYLKYAENNDGNLAITGRPSTYTDSEGNKISNTEIVNFYKSASVFSYPALVTYNGEKRAVTAIALSVNMTSGYMTTVTDIIINEGIKFIDGFESSSTLERLSLPSTLKVVQNAFNSLYALQSLTIPDGVEVMLYCLWANRTSAFDPTEVGKGYDFNIIIPKSVKNISMMPVEGIVFEEGSSFYISDKAIYKNDDGKTLLINDYDIDESGTLTVEEGVQGIQVGAFYGLITADFVYVPSTFTYVGYNESISDYPYAYYSTNSSRLLYVSSLVGEDGTEDFYGKMRKYAYSIYSNLGGGDIERIILLSLDYPEGMSNYAFCGSNGKLDRTAYEGTSLVYKKVVEDGEISVRANVTNSMTETTASVSFAFTAGDVLTAQTLREELGIDASDIQVVSVTEFGKDYDFTSTVTTNLYLDVVYCYNDSVSGFEITPNADGTTATVTSFNILTAKKLESDTYLVNIPETVTKDGRQYTVTAIGEGAFRDEASISHVFIPKTVKDIGKDAFSGCVNLISVNITPGGLETIGESAFRDTAFTTIKLPLANLKEVGPYAFKQTNLVGFLLADGETHETAFAQEAKSAGTLTVGRFYFYQYCDTNKYGSTSAKSYYYAQLLQYAGVSEEQIMTLSSYNDYSGENPSGNYTYDKVHVYDFKVYAVAGGMTLRNLQFGYSLRASTSGIYAQDKTFIFRAEIMTGSVYYLNTLAAQSTPGAIIFGMVKYVHKNAFTDMNEYYSTVTETTSGARQTKGIQYFSKTHANTDTYECWLTAEQLTSMDSSIFESGWWEGIEKDAAGTYPSSMDFIKYAVNQTYDRLTGDAW